MNKIIPTLIISLFISLPGFTKNNNYKNSKYQLTEKIDNYLFTEKNLRKSFVGIKVRNLSKNEDLYRYNAQKLFVPASNLKLYTSLFAIEELGPNFKFNTTISSNNKIKDNSINNIYINFVGDPSLKNNDINNLFKKLRNKGIKRINQKIIINRSVFDQEKYGPGWMHEDFNYCFSAPIDPIYIDNNCYEISFESKNGKIKYKTENSINLDYKNVEIANKTKLNLEKENNLLKISGNLKDNSSKNLEQAIIKPEEYAINIIKQSLEKNKISFSGEIKLINQEKIDKHSILAKKESEPLKYLIKRFNKKSDNLYGELILKTISEIKTNNGTTRNSTKLEVNFLKKKLFNNHFKIVGGSGLSRYNLISPSLTVRLLDYIYQDENLRKIFFEALPTGGKEGTLKNRMKNIPRIILAKSGSMTGINCISGYIFGENEEIIAFSIMINNSTLNGKKLREHQDKIIMEIITTLDL